MENFKKVSEGESFVQFNNGASVEPGLYKVHYPFAVEFNTGTSQHCCYLAISNRKEIQITWDNKGAQSSAITWLKDGTGKLIPVSEFILGLESLLAELKDSLPKEVTA